MLRKLLIIAALFTGIAGQAIAGQVVLQPDSLTGKDASINNGIVLNWGHTPYVTDNFGTSDQFGLLEFDLSAYLGQTITSATVKLFAALNPFPFHNYSISKNLGAWDEDTVTFATRPASGPVLDTITTSFGEQWYSFDVTSAVQDWLNGEANYGFLISETNGFVYFASSDHANSAIRPILQFETAEIPAPAPLTLLGIGILAFAASSPRKQ